MSTCTCPRCRRRFNVLDDEEGQHPCPGCGYEPEMWLDEEDEEFDEELADQMDEDVDCEVELTDDDDPTWPEEE
jgi:PHP family Zn ribbon phosphoesterase